MWNGTRREELIAAALVTLAAELDVLGARLASEPALPPRAFSELQALDRMAQCLNESARLLREGEAAGARSPADLSRLEPFLHLLAKAAGYEGIA